MTDAERADFVAWGLLIGSFVLAPFLMLPMVAPDYCKQLLFPPTNPVTVVMSVDWVGDCPAEAGFRGTYFTDKRLRCWRGQVLRALPPETYLDGYGVCPISPCFVSEVEVKSKHKRRITVHLIWGGSMPRIFYPARIVVE